MVVAVLVVTSFLAPASSGTQDQERAPRTVNTEVVGHLAPPQRGGYGDVWAHDDVAYLGNLRQGDCRPPNGVWAISLKDPAKPRALASFAKFPGSDGEDVWVGSVRTKAFKGDLAAVGVQRCSRQVQGFAGLALYDVTNPAKPKELGRLPSGVVSGVHEVGVVQRPDGRVLALAAVPYSFNLTEGRRGTCASSTSPTRAGPARSPTGTSAATARPRPGPARRPAGRLRPQRLAVRQGQQGVRLLLVGGRAVPGHQRPVLAPADRPDPLPPRGRLPRRPLGLVQRGRDPVRPERRDHAGGRQRVAAHLDLPAGVRHQRPGPAQAAVDLRHRGGRARQRRPGGLDGVYSVHNAVVKGDLSYASWYSDGVRVVDLSDPARPRESPRSCRRRPRPARRRPPPRAAAATCPWSGASSPGRTWSWPAT